MAELCGHRLIPYPNQASEEPLCCKFISVQSVVADWHGGLWILDTAALNFAPPIPGETKLVKLDLATGKAAQIYTFSEHVVLPTTYLNDVRFDFRAGSGGHAYLTDSSMWKVAADGIALSPCGETLYYCPLSGRFLYAIPTAALRDRSIPEEELAALVETVVEKGTSVHARRGRHIVCHGRRYSAMVTVI